MLAKNKHLQLQLPKTLLGKWVLFSAIGMVLLFGIANAGVGLFYSHRIYPRVTAADIPIGNLTTTVAAARLQTELKSKPVSLNLHGHAVKLSSQQAGLRWQTDVMVGSATKLADPLPLVNLAIHLLKPQAVQPVVLADNAITSHLSAQLAQQYSLQPTNASVVMNGQTATLVSNKSGLQYDSATISRDIMQAAVSGKPVVVGGKSVSASITSQNLAPAVAVASKIAKCTVTLNIQGTSYPVSQQTLDGWIVVNTQSAAVTINPQAVAAYVATLAAKYNVAAQPSVVTTLDGAVIGSQTGKAGQALDQPVAVSAIVNALQQKTSLNTAVAVAAVAPTTQYLRQTSAATTRHILVSIGQQHLWAYAGSTVVYSTAVITGASSLDEATPTGTWRIYSKVTDTNLVGPTWDDFVQHWMPFFGAYGLHDASWRDPSQFGTQTYPTEGSHGCVELPVSASAWIFNWVSVGTSVTVEN